MAEPTAHSLGRNDPCHCGSGKKYKRCCLRKDEEAEREARAEEAANAPPPPAEEQIKPEVPHPHNDQPWKREAQKHPPFQRFVTPRKSGSS